MNSRGKRESTKARLTEMLAVIRRSPGIRASEINRRMGLEHSWNLRSKLIDRGLVRREDDGAAVRYYLTD